MRRAVLSVWVLESAVYGVYHQFCGTISVYVTLSVSWQSGFERTGTYDAAIGSLLGAATTFELLTDPDDADIVIIKVCWLIL